MNYIIIIISVLILIGILILFLTIKKQKGNESKEIKNSVNELLNEKINNLNGQLRDSQIESDNRLSNIMKTLDNKFAISDQATTTSLKNVGDNIDTKIHGHNLQSIEMMRTTITNLETKLNQQNKDRKSVV